MLHLMRKHARSWLINIMIGGIIIVFVFMFGWSDQGDQGNNNLAVVNEVPISLAAFGVRYRAEMEILRHRYKGSLPPDLLEKLNLKQTVLQQMINELLLLEQGEKLGYFVTDDDLIEDIRSDPRFQSNNAFDERLYKAFLHEIKLTPSMYEAIRRRQLLREQVQRLLSDGVKFDPNELEELWHFQNDKLVLSMLLIKPEEPKLTSNDTKSLEAYFKKNQKEYELPRSVDIEYVSLSWKDLEKGITVDEKEARDYYNNNPKEFLIPEKARVRHILLKKPPNADKEKMEELRKKIEAIRDRIKSGEDFEKLAKEESQDEATAEKGGDLGTITRKTLDPVFEETAFSLVPDEVSEPVLTPQGYHLIRVDEKKPEEQMEFDSMKEKIITKLQGEKARAKVDLVADDLYEEIYRKEDLDGPIQDLKLEKKKAEGVNELDGIPDVGNDADVMDELFSLKSGEVSKLLKSGENYLIIKVVKENPARMPKLDEVRISVEKDYLKQQAEQKAREKAEKILESLKKSPGKFDEVAKKFGLTWDKLDPVARTATLVPKLGAAPEVREMLATVSEAAPVFPSPVPVTQGIGVFRLMSLEPASKEEFAKEAPRFRQWVKQIRTTEYLNGWLKLLGEEAKIVRNDDLLKTGAY